VEDSSLAEIFCVKKKAKSDLEILAELRAAMRCPDEPAPEGFRTIDEIARAWEISETQTRRILFAGMAIGRVEKITLQRLRNHVNFYRFKD
jgi:hypothetical protein